MKKYIISFVLLFASFFSYSQQGDGGTPTGLQFFSKSGVNVPFYAFEKPDVITLREEDRINDSLQIGPWRFGHPYATHIDLLEEGTKLTKENGDQVILLKITTEEAKTINLTFSNTYIPEGNELYVYNPEGSFVLGKFTENHIYKGELGTELVPGEEVIIEYYIPVRNQANTGSVIVSKVTHGYRTAQEYQAKAFGSSGNCNMNVNCSDGLPYKDQRNSTVMLVVGSSGFCTGALINNTNFDGKPYVLTANHCYSSNITSWIVRFNWQAEGCVNPPVAPSFQSLSGAQLKSRRVPTDFCLFEIMGGLSNGTVPETHQPYFAGWDKSGAVPTRTFAIHHPSGDIKKISFGDQAPTITQATISGTTSEADGLWKVIWTRNTVTEGGSSGGPLFNHQGRIIGQLWGGNSGCYNAGTPNAYDFYGRLSKSWEPSGSNSTNQLKYWLDPNDNGNTSIVGYDPYHSSYSLDAAILEIQNYEENFCTSAFNPSVIIMNKGTSNLTSLTINYTYNGQAGSVNWVGNLATYGSEIVSLPLFENQDGNNTIEITLNQPNGGTDEQTDDNTMEVSFQANVNNVELEFEFYMACWPQENSWQLKDAGNNILYSGGNYPAGGNFNFLATESFCLPNGCYTLVLKDSYGDGVQGSVHATCDFDGSMTLTQVLNGEIMAHLPESDANFGYERSFEFCINTADLAKFSLEQKIKVYPNPSSGEFAIKMDFEGEKNIVLTNLEGRIVSTYQVNDNFLNIIERSLSSGIYMLTISNGVSSTTKKIIIN